MHICEQVYLYRKLMFPKKAIAQNRNMLEQNIYNNGVE